MAGPAREKDIDVLCIGMIVYDVIGKSIDDIPDWGRLLPFDHVEHHVGGCAVNTGVDLVRLSGGRLRVAVGGCVGTDGAAAFVRRRLAEQHVDVSPIVEAGNASTSFTFVIVGSDGRRRYFHHVGANALLKDSDVPDDLLERARYLHIGGSFLMPALDGEPCSRLLRRAKKAGLTTFMDTAYNPAADCRSLIEPCIEHLDVFIPSIEEAERITGRKNHEEVMEALGAYDCPVVGVKLGADGCMLRSRGETRHYPAFWVDAVDTTGAGDAFMAGFIYGMLHDWDIDRTADFANATAAHCIRAIGCSTGIRPAEEVEGFMNRAQRREKQVRGGE
jgi:sugar/nucleoside kinase (ribokinase family)